LISDYLQFYGWRALMSFSFSGSLPFMLLFFAIVNVLANKYSLSLSLSLSLSMSKFSS